MVSRTLLQNDVGMVTLFAFDSGHGLSEHTTPFDALVHVVEGEGDLIIGGESHRVEAGQVVLMPADVPHAVRAAGRFKMLLTMLRARGGREKLYLPPAALSTALRRARPRQPTWGHSSLDLTMNAYTGPSLLAVAGRL